MVLFMSTALRMQFWYILLLLLWSSGLVLLVVAVRKGTYHVGGEERRHSDARCCQRVDLVKKTLVCDKSRGKEPLDP